MRKLRIALTKGRLEKKSVELFEKMGLDCTELINKGRRLILPVGDYEAVCESRGRYHVCRARRMRYRNCGKRHNSRKRQKLL